MDLQLLLSIFAGFLTALGFVKAWVTRQRLSHIPTVGASGIFSSYVGAYRFLSRGKEMIEEGYRKYPGGVFKIPTLSGWHIIVSGREKVDDLRKANVAELSFPEAAAEEFQLRRTVGADLPRHQYHVSAVRSALPPSIATGFPDIQDEIVQAFADYIPQTEEWTNVLVFCTFMQIIARASNRLFFGLPLCRNAEFLSLNAQFGGQVVVAAHKINLFPGFLQPIVGHIFNASDTINRTMHHLRPIILGRLEKEQEYGLDWPEKPNDVISWFLQASQGKPRSVRDLTERVLNLNVASVHATSTVFVQVLFDLAAYPEYIPALREEVEAVVKEAGLSKASLREMRKLDSFIKESMRLGTQTAQNVNRKTMKDFRFSDGTLVPKGYVIGVASLSTHCDGAYYTEPEKFDGFRFSRMGGDEPEGFRKHEISSLDLDYIVFGHGRNACPGRFLAAAVMKAVTVHILLTYDVAFENDGPRPKNIWYGSRGHVDPEASVMFRRRRGSTK